MKTIHLFDASKVPQLGGNVDILVHEVDLYDEKGKGDPATREGSNGKAVEKIHMAMRGHGCQDEDGGDGVETEVEDCHSLLQPSAHLPSSLSKRCDC